MLYATKRDTSIEAIDAEGKMLNIYVRILLVTAVAVGVGGCGTVAQDLSDIFRGGLETAKSPSSAPNSAPITPATATSGEAGVCQFDGDLVVAADTSADEIRAAASDNDRRYLFQRCRKLIDAKAHVGSIRIFGRPLGIRISNGRDTAFGVQLSLSNADLFIPKTSFLRSNVHDDLGQLARRFLGDGPPRTIFVTSTSTDGKDIGRATVIASALVSAGLINTEIFTQNAPSLSDTSAGNLKIVELQSRDAVLAYVGLIGDPSRQFTIYREPNGIPGPNAQEKSIGIDKTSEAKSGEKASGSQPRSVSLSTQTQIATVPASKPGGNLLLGGRAIMDTHAPLARSVGEIENNVGWWARISPFQSAYADIPKNDLKLACIDTRFWNLGFQESLSRGKAEELHSSEYLPMLYGTSWKAELNGTLIGLADVRVLRDDARPDGGPRVLVYLNFKDKNQDPDIITQGAVYGRLGKIGILYRIFLNEDAWPLRCIDLIFSRENKGLVTYGKFYYDHQGTVMGIEFLPQPVQRSH